MQGFHQSFWSRRTVSHSVATSWRRNSVARRLSPSEHRLPFSERLLEHGGAVSSLAAQQWKKRKQTNPAGPGRQTQADSNVTKKFIWRQTMAGGWTSWSNVDGCGRKTWVNPCFKIVKWEKASTLERLWIGEKRRLWWENQSWWGSPRFDPSAASSAPPSGSPQTPPMRTSGATLPMRRGRMEATTGTSAG